MPVRSTVLQDTPAEWKHLEEEVCALILAILREKLRLRKSRGSMYAILNGATKASCLHALERHKYNVSHAAEMMGIARTTLQLRMRMLDIQRPEKDHA